MISRGFPTDRDPQWGCFEQDQAEALAKNGNKVIVISVDSRFLFRFRKLGVSNYCKDGVVYYNIFCAPAVITRNISEKFFKYLIERQLSILYKRVEKDFGKPDIIYSHFCFNTAYAVSLKRKYNIPLVAIEHLSFFNNDQLPKRLMEEATIAYNNSDRIISVSENLRDRVLYHLGKDSVVVNNLVNSAFFNNVKRIENGQERIKFIAVGSLFHVKGHDVLIKAFSIVSQKYNNIELHIVGEGYMRNELETIIKTCHLEDLVYLHGKKSKTDIIELLKSSSCFVHPSRSENFSVAVLEALAIGLPVIATICGGIRDCINDKNGILVPVESVDELARALDTMCLNLSKYNPQYISNDCYNRYSLSVVHNLEQIFQDVLNNK